MITGETKSPLYHPEAARGGEDDQIKCKFKNNNFMTLRRSKLWRDMIIMKQ